MNITQEEDGIGAVALQIEIDELIDLYKTTKSEVQRKALRKKYTQLIDKYHKEHTPNVYVKTLK